MKFIVDEMPTEPSECPFFIGTSKKTSLSMWTRRQKNETLQFLYQRLS